MPIKEQLARAKARSAFLRLVRRGLALASLAVVLHQQAFMVRRRQKVVPLHLVVSGAVAWAGDYSPGDGGTGGGTGGGGGSREGGGGWPGTAVAEETMWWRDGAGGAEGELRFRPGLVGAIFLTNQGNEEECLRRGLFGLPNRQAAMVRDIDAAPESTLIFLYNFQHRKMLGAFVAAGRAGFPLHADAWTRADPRPGTRRRKTGRTDFPAQACSRSVAAPACNRSHTSLQPYEQLAPFLYAQLPVAWHGARRGMPQLPLDRFRHLLRYEGTSSRFEQVLDETQVLGK